MTNQAASATASSPLVTLLVVDDHTLFRRGLIGEFYASRLGRKLGFQHRG